MTTLRYVRFLALAALFGAPACALAENTPSPATPSCKSGDAVVWENTSSKTKAYHPEGDKYFGKTSHGKYACESDAKAAGYHAAASTGKGGSTATATPSPAPTSTGKHHRHHGASASPSPAATPA